MKSIACVNFSVPNAEANLSYDSKTSLRDYDIIIFNPYYPYYSRIQFTGGGSCIDIDGTRKLLKSMSHWKGEIKSALETGKTVFIILNEVQIDQGATGITSGNKSTRTYQTVPICNYDALPARININNSNGKSIVLKDSKFSGIFNVLKDMLEYRVIFTEKHTGGTIFTAKDGTPLGVVKKLSDTSGRIVFLPFFDFDNDNHTKLSRSGVESWKDDSVKIAQAFFGQIKAIDKFLKSSGEKSPRPDWLDAILLPDSIKSIDSLINKIDSDIQSLTDEKKAYLAQREDLIDYQDLIFETGKRLENAISKALRLLGYSVETFRSDALEIDHVIVGPSGKRMIGESEGKDNNAVDISKFRQLESNIGEDFERDDVEVPAKGIIFGNGYRLINVEDRPEQFTKKCLLNANRLGSALVRTSDLYPVVVHLLNNPSDEKFRTECRNALESTAGEIVVFPKLGDSILA